MQRAGLAGAEQSFFNDPLLVVPDMKPSAEDMRLHALGHADDGRLSHISIVLPNAGTLVRVISARNMSRKEKAFYVPEVQPDTQICD